MVWLPAPWNHGGPLLRNGCAEQSRLLLAMFVGDDFGCSSAGVVAYDPTDLSPPPIFLSLPGPRAEVSNITRVRQV